MATAWSVRVGRALVGVPGRHIEIGGSPWTHQPNKICGNTPSRAICTVMLTGRAVARVRPEEGATRLRVKVKGRRCVCVNSSRTVTDGLSTS